MEIISGISHILACLDWVTYKWQNFFLTIPVSGKSKIKAPADSDSGENLLPGL